MNNMIARGMAAAFLAFATIALGGCETNPATGRPSFAVFMGPDDEARVGAQEHPKILVQFGGVYDDAKVAGYVAQLGGRLVANSEMPRFPFTFTVLNTPTINAFALPGGYVYVTRGLVALANSEAELAGVIAHEIGHVTARHTAERYSTAVAAQIGLTILGAATGSGDLVDLGQLGGSLALASFSRSQELEADALGIRYLRNAGYDPKAMAQFLKSLEADKNLMARIFKRELPNGDLFATHPPTPERVATAAQIAGSAGGVVNRDPFLNEISGMLYGDDPEQGFVRDEVFTHPKLRFMFRVPPGFPMTNSQRAVVARKRDTGLIRFDSAPRNQSHPDPLTYLTQIWGRQLNLIRPERIEVNGLRGATAATRTTGTLDDYRGALDLRLVVLQAPANTLYRFLFVSRPQATASLLPDYQRTTFSFRLLSEAEAKNLQPLTVELTPVKPGDTQASLAAGLPFADLKTERFRILNGLAPGELPPVGERVKIVAE
jgi:predicted Zn-dependent protease